MWQRGMGVSKHHLLQMVPHNTMVVKASKCLRSSRPTTTTTTTKGERSQVQITSKERKPFLVDIMIKLRWNFNTPADGKEQMPTEPRS